MPDCYSPESLARTLASVDELAHAADAALDARAALIAAVPPERRFSAENLAMYLSLRAHDLRPLQRQLHALSLSSLGRMEPHVDATLRGVRFALQALRGEASSDRKPPAVGDRGDHLLTAHADDLLGPAPASRQTRVMVTLPGEASQRPELIADLLCHGMDVARINLAHDGPEVWTAMFDRVRAAAASSGRRCRVLADLPGPKLRIGAIEPGPEVVRVRPDRDALGIVTAPATVVFRDPGAAAPPDAAAPVVVPLRAPLACLAEVGDEFVVIDTRGRRRRFLVTAVDGPTCTAATERTAYLGTGCAVSLHRGITLANTEIGRMPALPGVVSLATGDILLVTRDDQPGRAARIAADGRYEPARIPCAMAAVFADARPDHRILFDDGRIAGLVLANGGDHLRVRITATPPGGGKLRAEKGINLPDTELRGGAGDAGDADTLDWIARHADLVGMSFVQRPEDVLQLQDELRRRGRADAGIVLKIETATAFERLPDLLFAGLRTPRLGVMVARGDLAVEVGYARLAEVQEEILWLCEAAHVPVVWATQVLDSMARTGVPSRAEVTDAAMGVQAECVMLNKGPHIVATVGFLGGVLERMQAHHAKKHSLLRQLRVARGPTTA